MPSAFVSLRNNVVSGSKTLPKINPKFSMKSLFSNNTVAYKQHSLAAGGVGTVRNNRHKGKHT